MSMCIVPSQACASHELLKLLHLKIMRCQHLRFTQLSKVWARLFQSFRIKSSSYKKLWDSLFSHPFLRNGVLEISVDLVPCRKSQQPCSIYSLPASQVGAIEEEIFSSNQGSRKVNVEKSSVVYSCLVRAHNLQILRIKQGSTPRINRSFLVTLLFVAIVNVKRGHWAFSFFSPSRSIL
jgi:hypothetical protein